MIGFGSVAQGLLPLLIRDLNIPADQIRVLSADLKGSAVARSFGVSLQGVRVSAQNFQRLLEQYVEAGDVVLNLAVEVSSLDLINWCQTKRVLYLDTGIEPWRGGYAKVQDPATRHETTNYWLRHEILQHKGGGKSTAVIAHGANPGLVSHFVKAALFELACERGITTNPATAHWGQLAQELQIQVIQIAERDSQRDRLRLEPGEFACTWSVDGLLAEARQAPEFGWGTHESALLPGMALHEYGCRAAGVWWPDHSTSPLRRVVSWTPGGREQLAWLITHNEAISLADYLTVRDEQARLQYRPTVYYAYSPCASTAQSLLAWEAQQFAQPRSKRLIRANDILDGEDELGVLLCYPGGAYWYGSTLSAAHAKTLAPHNSATSLQVVAGVFSALKWAMAHPNRGIVEAEDLDSVRILRYAAPYLGTLAGVHTPWQPSAQGGLQFQQFIKDSRGKESQAAPSYTIAAS